MDLVFYEFDTKKFMRVKRPNMRTQKGCVSAFNKTNKSGTEKLRKKDINGIDFFHVLMVFWLFKLGR